MSHLRQWVPYKLLAEQEQTLCRWLYVGDKPFHEPFFDDTIARCRSGMSFRPHSVSNISLLKDWASALPAIEPTAIIFHISRCGSTLVSQLLGINPDHIVLSEVPFLDEVLRAPYKAHAYPAFEQMPALEGAIRFYGQKRTGNESRLFIKTDSWHVLFYKTIRRLYPHAPFILLYREPYEVIHSHRKKAGMQAVPGVIEPAIFGFETPLTTDMDAYMTNVIEKYLSVFIEIAENDPRALPVSYNEGMMHVMEKIADFIDLPLSREEYLQMQARCSYHAKFPDQVFTTDPVPAMTPAWLQKCQELYNRLFACSR